MSEINLGEIERVGVKEVWPDEARDFTPWLADNLEMLGDALGVELKLVRTEAKVGGFSLDILAQDDDGSDVAIENQFGKTDHPHLGKLLTYAAGVDAAKIVWVAEEFRDEHRVSLDWLNGRTDENAQFFGVVVELWKIDGSRPAPRFGLFASPNSWTVQLPTGGNGPINPEIPLTDNQKRYIQFWRPLLETLNSEHRWNVRTRNSDSWFDASAGLINFKRTMRFGNGKAQVQIRIDSTEQSWNEGAFDLLEQRRDEIEEKIGDNLVWDRNERAKVSHISMERNGAIRDSDEDLKEIRHWMLENIEKIKTVFLPYIREVSNEMNRAE